MAKKSGYPTKVEAQATSIIVEGSDEIKVSHRTGRSPVMPVGKIQQMQKRLSQVDAPSDTVSTEFNFSQIGKPKIFSERVSIPGVHPTINVVDNEIKIEPLSPHMLKDIDTSPLFKGITVDELFDENKMHDYKSLRQKASGPYRA